MLYISDCSNIEMVKNVFLFLAGAASAPVGENADEKHQPESRTKEHRKQRHPSECGIL